MEEYIARVGQQAAVIYCTPGKSQHQPNYYKVVGSQPLQSVVSIGLCTVLCWESPRESPSIRVVIVGVADF